MGLNKERAFDVLRKISFERIAGTEKELECAHILEEECKKAGVDPSNLWSGRTSKKNIKKVRKLLESEVAKLYIIEDDNNE